LPSVRKETSAARKSAYATGLASTFHRLGDSGRKLPMPATPKTVKHRLGSTENCDKLANKMGLRNVCPVLLGLALTCQAAKPAPALSPFGVAVKTGSKICFSIRKADLPLKTIVTLVAPSGSQSAAPAKIVEISTTGCPGIGDDKAAYASYELEIVRGTMEDYIPLIAVVARPERFHTIRSTIRANLSSEHQGGEHQADTFRSCTSAEGVHLTVWQGEPLEGKRVWHQYYYLGQDLEPNCTDKDTAP